MNQVIRDPALKGTIWVNGLFVCDAEGYEFGYNFSADRLELDRDRGVVGGFDLEAATARVCADSLGMDELFSIMSRKEPPRDVAQVGYRATGYYSGWATSTRDSL